MAKLKIRPLNDKIVVKRVEAETKTKGGIVLPDTAKEKPKEGVVVSLGNGKLLPEERDFQPPPATLPRSPGHWVEWVNYAKGNGPVPGSNFQYSGWTTETNHLGNVAYRTGKKIEWDYQAMRATNAPAADPFIKRPEYRKGWEGILKA